MLLSPSLSLLTKCKYMLMNVDEMKNNAKPRHCSRPNLNQVHTLLLLLSQSRSSSSSSSLVLLSSHTSSTFRDDRSPSPKLPLFSPRDSLSVLSLFTFSASRKTGRSLVSRPPRRAHRLYRSLVGSLIMIKRMKKTKTKCYAQNFSSIV